MPAPKLKLVEQPPERAASKSAPPSSEASPKSKSKSKPKRSAKVVSPPVRRSVKGPAIAADLMRRDVVRCSPSDSLNVAAQLLWDNNLGALVVVNGAGAPISMVTDRDICFAAYTQGVPLWATQVSSAMARGLRVCSTTTPIADVRTAMREARVRRIPVVDEAGELVGIIGMKELCDDASGALKKGHKRASSAPEVLELVTGILAGSAETSATA